MDDRLGKKARFGSLWSRLEGSLPGSLKPNLQRSLWVSLQINLWIGPQGSYVLTDPPVWAEGSKYGPLLSDGRDLLCPDCGGYGRCGWEWCDFCEGRGVLDVGDARLTVKQPFRGGTDGDL